MTSIVDLWRAVDPDARLVSGAPEALPGAVRGVIRTRAAPPHLPAQVDGQLLVADAALLAEAPLETLLQALQSAQLRPVAILLAGVASAAAIERAGGALPVLASARGSGDLADVATAYLDDEAGHLARLSTALRLAAAEAALSDPQPSAPAGLVAGRLRRGVAVSADGELRTLHARPAGHALAARFAALHGRLLADLSTRTDATRLTRDGLWLMEHRIRPGASIWLFDDLPFARVDHTAAEALSITLRALLRRAIEPTQPPAVRPVQPQLGRPAATDDALDATLLAVARANGRVAPAARSLGVHRNTVLYRLRRARAERGIDPRRPEDALRLLRDAER